MKNKMILVADENSPVRTLTAVFTAEGFEVEQGENVPEVCRAFDPYGAQLVLVDFDMPADRGWDVIRAVKGLNPFVPIIVVTRRAALAELLAPVGVDALAEKPVDVKTLLRTVGQLLSEPLAERVERICNRLSNFRHVAPEPWRFCDDLLKRYTAPFLCTSETKRWGLNE